MRHAPLLCLELAVAPEWPLNQNHRLLRRLRVPDFELRHSAIGVSLAIEAHRI